MKGSVRVRSVTIQSRPLEPVGLRRRRRVAKIDFGVVCKLSVHTVSRLLPATTLPTYLSRS
jgi:hypothetical protein